MILLGAAAWVSESCCLSDSRREPGGLGGAGCPELVPAAAGVLGAQRDDAGGALDGPVHAGLLGALDDDLLAGCLDVARSGEHAEPAVAGVAHAVDVVLEVADLPFQVAGLDAFERVGAGGGDDGLDVAGVELGAAV